MARPVRGTTVADRFWANVANRGGEGCWEWTGHIGKANRYGMIRVDGRSVKVHRVSYAMHSGPIPSGYVVRHTCDNPKCVRPDHLVLGTQGDNVADAIERGRFTRAPRGRSGRWEASEPVTGLAVADSLAPTTVDRRCDNGTAPLGAEEGGSLG